MGLSSFVFISVHAETRPGTVARELQKDRKCCLWGCLSCGFLISVRCPPRCRPVTMINIQRASENAHAMRKASPNGPEVTHPWFGAYWPGDTENTPVHILGELVGLDLMGTMVLMGTRVKQ